MSVRNVVKVMNFHSLIRVDKSKRLADKYKMMGDQLEEMMAAILNNRNFILDKRLFLPDSSAPKWNIYLGSDFGFCNNYNSQVTERLRDDKDAKKIIIGKKIAARSADNVIFSCNEKDLKDEYPKLKELIADAIRNRKCSAINIVYNHYENTTTIYPTRKQIYPVRSMQQEGKVYTEDFVIEQDADEVLMDMVISYVNYELMLAIVSGRASENVLRQNATTESLKKIDELEEEKYKAHLREKRNVEFGKVIDTFVKTKIYE